VKYSRDTVAAAVVFGATRRSANQTFTFGGGDVSDGGAPRTAEQNAGLQPYVDADKLREYCQPHDPICAPHTQDTDMKYHLDYFDKWGDEVADWVVGKARPAAAVPEGNAGSADQTSGASDMLKKGISHPVSNVFLVLVALLAL
jgi:acetylxylan esterase